MNVIDLIPYVYAKFAAFMLIFTRIAALFSTFVVFRQNMVNSKVIVGFSSMLSLFVLVYLNHAQVQMDVFSFSMIVNLIFQVFVGFLAGLILNIVFEIFTAAGQLISTQIGIGLAGMFDPQMGMITTLTQFYMMTMTLLFLLLNGHIFVFDTMIRSFAIIPLGEIAQPSNIITEILHYSSVMFSGSVLLSITIIVAIMATNFALAIMSKFAPQFNLFSVGINMVLVLGLICVYFTFGLLIEKGTSYFQDGFTFLVHSLRRLA